MMSATLATCPPLIEQIDGFLRIIDYMEPALRGTNVTLTCPAGLILTGPDMLTCAWNGEWEPDPKDAECTESTLSRDGKIAVASSITVFVMTSLIFIIVGFLCGHCCQTKRRTAVGTLPPSEETYNTPYYDDIIVLKQRDEQELELKENVAYGTQSVTM